MVALRQLGVTEVIAVSAMGGLAYGYEPGELVFVNDTIDRTWGRVSTVFEGGLAAHVVQGICPRLRQHAHLAAAALGISHQSSGTLVVIQGPQFSTPAESVVHRAWGAHVVGMTSQPEAKLARELGMCYVLIGQVTDLDNPPDGHHGVTQQEVSSRIADLSDKAAGVIMALVDYHVDEAKCNCAQSLVGAILTAPDHMAVPSSRLCAAFGIKEIPPEWFASH
jgi:5'-methylthioadenosine phosphorylase